MTPMLGIMASSISGSKAITGNYYSISTATVTSGGTTSVTFSSIPSTYTHLQVRAFSKGDYATASPVAIAFRFNGDSGANYAIHYLYGAGSGGGASGSFTSATVGYVGVISDAVDNANVFGACVMDVLDYTNTNKYKTTRSISGYDTNGSGQIYFNSSLWMNTTAVTSLTITPGAGTNFNQYSSFALYGVK